MTKKSTQKPAHDELKQQLADMEANWKRALADYQNLQKRTREQHQALVQLATADLIQKLLPVVDHLELALSHLNDPGLNMVVKQFINILDAEGVKKIDTADQPFDPHTMECVEQVSGADNQVIELVANGYRLGDRVIRPAKVKVGNGEL